MGSLRRPPPTRPAAALPVPYDHEPLELLCPSPRSSPDQPPGRWRRDEVRMSDDSATRARPGGRGLPHRVAARARHADPPARRLRPRRGGAARRLPRGAGAVAARGRAGESAGLAGLGRPLQGDRRACAGARASTPLDDAAPSSSSAADGDRRAVGRRERRGRPAAADLHLLPSGAGAGRAGGAHAARGVRPHDRGDRAAPSSPPAPTLAQRIVRAKAKIRDARIPYQVPARGRAARAARRGAARDLPRVQRGLLRLVRRSR